MAEVTKIDSRDTSLDIYSDGSYKHGNGAWAFVIVQDGRLVKEASARVRETTSLRMEMQAAIEALEVLPLNSRVTLFSDCRILTQALAVPQSERKIRKNVDLLARLDYLNSQHKISWTWVKAHSGNRFNEYCDQLCLLARGN